MKANFFKTQNYIKELSVVEHIILWLNVALSLAFFIASLAVNKQAVKDWTVWVACLTSIGSIFSVMAGVKKRPLCPLLGIICSVLLIAVAWKNHLYGNMIMYGVNVVIQSVSLATWMKDSKQTGKITPKAFPTWAIIVYLIGFAILAGLFAWMEGFDWFYGFWSGGSQTEPNPVVVNIFDAITLMFILSTCLPMIKKYDWVWYTYMINDIGLMGVWIAKIVYGASNPLQCATMVTSATFMLITNILGILNWRKSKKSK